MTVLALCFAALAAVYLWTLARLDGSWKHKLPFTVALPVLAVAMFVWVHRVPQGWPYPAKPDGEFLAGVVREPSPGDPGAIFLWVAAGNQPRAFSVPYSRKLHEQVEAAKGAVKQGRHVMVKRQGSSHGRYRFYRQPPTRLPRKKG